MRRADNLTNFMCRLSLALGASASWNPLGLSSPVMGLLYLTGPVMFNPLNAKLNPICHLLALLEAHRILHVSRIRVKDGCS
jgi:hypothetical protein